MFAEVLLPALQCRLPCSRVCMNSSLFSAIHTWTTVLLQQRRVEQLPCGRPALRAHAAHALCEEDLVRKKIPDPINFECCSACLPARSGSERPALIPQAAHALCAEDLVCKKIRDPTDFECRSACLPARSGSEWPALTPHAARALCAEDLVRKKIRDPTDFEWLKQCRFYWRDDRDTVIISICDVDFEYSFEYLGASAGGVPTPGTLHAHLPRPVATPLSGQVTRNLICSQLST